MTNLRDIVIQKYEAVKHYFRITFNAMGQFLRSIASNSYARWLALRENIKAAQAKKKELKKQHDQSTADQHKRDGVPPELGKSEQETFDGDVSKGAGEEDIKQAL